MPTKYIVDASAHIAAPAARAYGIIADYNVGHPSILPKPFRNFAVEQGGVGAGTVIRFEMHVFGNVTKCRAAVSEPQPGRVLVETNIEPPSKTTFTVVPDGEHACTVTFLSEFESRDGLAGAIERFMATRFLKKVYREELGNLATRATQTAPTRPDA